MPIPSSLGRARALLLAITLVVVACGDSGPTGPVEPEIQAAEHSIFLAVGESRTLAVAVVPTNATWEALSDDTEVATVSRTANSITVTGVGTGFATVFLTMPQHPGVNFQVAVEVTST